MKSSKVLIMTVICYLFALNPICFAEDTKTESKKDYSAAITKATTDKDGKSVVLTAAIVKALMAEAAKDGAAEKGTAAQIAAAEVAMVKALMAKFPKQAVMIATTAFSCCSKAAVVGIAKESALKCPELDFESLYASSVAANQADSEALAVIFKIQNGVTGIGLNGGAGGIKGVITGQRNNNTEKKASP